MALSPVVVDFHTRNLDNVLKALKSVSDAVQGVEKKSTAASNMASSEREKRVKKEAAEASKAIVDTSKKLDVAQKNDAKSVADGLKKRLQNQTLHLIAVRKEEDRASKESVKAFNKWSNEQATIRKKAEKNVADSQDRSLKSAISFFKSEISELDKAEVQKRALRKVSEKTLASSQASQHSAAAAFFNKEIALADRLTAAKMRAHHEILRGGNGAGPALSPQARISLLNSARGKTPAEQEKILAQSESMRSSAQLDRKRRQKDDEDFRKGEKKKTRDLEQEEKRRLAIKERSATMAGQLAKREAAREATERKQAESKAHQSREGFARTVSGAGSAAVRSATTIAGRAAAGFLGLGGGANVQETLQDRLNLERSAVLLSNKSVTPQSPTRVASGDLLKQAKANAVTTGTDASDIMAGMHTYFDQSGKMASPEQVEFFSKLAKSNGSSAQQVMGLAGTMRAQDKDMSEKDMKNLLLSAVMQSRQGAIDFPELVATGGKITRTAGNFQGNQATNMGKLLGLSQIVMRVTGKGVGGAANAGTVLANVESDARFHKQGVEALLGKKIVDDQGRMMAPDQLMGDLVDAAMGKKGGMTNLTQVGGDGKKMFNKQAIKGFQALALTYNPEHDQAIKDGKTEAEAHAAGMVAVRNDIKDKVVAPYSEEEMKKDFSEVMQSAAEQLEGAVRQLKTEVADQLIPVVKDLIPIFQKLVVPLGDVLRGLVKLGTWATNNPLSGMAALLGAAFAKELAAAGIKAGLEKALSTSLGQKGGLLIGTAFIAATAASIVIEKLAADDKERQTQSVNSQAEATSAISDLNAGIRDGAPSAQQVERAKKAREWLERSAKTAEENKGGSDALYGVGLGMGAGLSILNAGTLGFSTKLTGKDGLPEVINEHELAVQGSEKHILDLKEQIATLSKSINSLSGVISKEEPAKPKPSAVDVLSGGTTTNGGTSVLLNHNLANVLGGANRTQSIPGRTGQ